MSDASVSRVLILAEPAVAARWEEMLRGADAHVWVGREAIPPGERPAVILADSHVPLAARDDVGVIVVGGRGPGDICLPAAASPDEIRRTCRLLAEVVALRRGQREAARVERELSAAAMTDPLTGLANRRAWDVELDARFAQATAARRLCVAMIDLDRFKEVNDARGHAAGDRLLQEAARTMQVSVRQDDFIARFGGDEFGLLLWTPGEPQAAAIVERVRRRVAETASAAGFAGISASAGFAVSKVPAAGESPKDLFLAADAALIAAKRAGRDRSAQGAIAASPRPGDSALG